MLSKARESGADPSAPPSLRPSEWILTLSLLLVIASLFAIANLHSRLFKQALEISFVEVSIEGFVSKPGAYSIQVGTPLEEVLRKAKPKPLADLKGIDLQTRVKEAMHLVIAPLAELTICLEGAVLESGPVRVPVGARLCDLKAFGSSEADSAFFKKKRRLKEGEKVVIPSKP